MIKKQLSKQDVRRDLDDQVAQFLAKGGAISQVPTGKSGDSKNNPWITPLQLSGSRTGQKPVTHVLNAIDARKQARKKPLAKAKPKKPVKQWIYDDFGEPIRWIWKK